MRFSSTAATFYFAEAKLGLGKFRLGKRGYPMQIFRSHSVPISFLVGSSSEAKDAFFGRTIIYGKNKLALGEGWGWNVFAVCNFVSSFHGSSYYCVVISVIGKLAFFEMLRLSVRRQVFFLRRETNKGLFPISQRIGKEESRFWLALPHKAARSCFLALDILRGANCGFMGAVFGNGPRKGRILDW